MEEEEEQEGKGGGGVDAVIRGGTSRNAGDSKNGRPDNVYKLRILGAISAGALLAQSDPASFLSKLAAEDKDGKGWVTCARDLVY